jgi:geranylgeranyl diphosphate synthase type I
LGEAFQLRDDVLGSFGDPALTGKDRDTDIREGKRTTLVAKAIEMSDPPGARLLEGRLGAPDLTEPEVEDIRETIRTSGALAETIALIGSLAAQAKEAIPGLIAPADVAAEMAALADLVALREA